ncbi:putative S-adenosylmethionine-dependent methyltransferase [Citrus sinensis]|uniref:loganic acid O-methyltransferase n=1 Tax=Citrus sinensis TaxID=2711 RepID=UPI00219DA80E|nr:loganic acid O-methyltransferase [Citrus sinensis]KAH9646772.1 putative S-adenosylmethionine-dependent methyltransferase [Citrus sinensis]
MAVDEVVTFPMMGGDGTCSYAHNSQFQRGTVDAAKELVREAIVNKLDVGSYGYDNSYTVRIADLGCSVGPNTFISVQNIIEALEFKFQNLSLPVPDFQVFFNDHTENDFNTLFRTLPPRKYYAAGVPGSFHGRLFPKSTLHVVNSFNAMHWLSKTPKVNMLEKSLEWNQGSIKCTRFMKGVHETFQAQFRSDFESILNARAEELVPGGLMVFSLITGPSGIPFADTVQGATYNFLGSCLWDLAKMGVISEEKVCTFNVPAYFPYVEELESLIQRNGHFAMERMQQLDQPMRHKTFPAQFYLSHLRAVLGGLIGKHFGEELLENIFNHINTKEAEILSIHNGKLHKEIEVFVVLKRISKN